VNDKNPLAALIALSGIYLAGATATEKRATDQQPKPPHQEQADSAKQSDASKPKVSHDGEFKWDQRMRKDGR
jgi:hypothetical protein